MGFYIRKGFNFGPLRLNLSRSGLGLSAGVKGFRIGLGPRGTYLHAGRGGLYYRQSLGRLDSSSPSSSPPQRAISSPGPALSTIATGSTEQFTTASSGALLAELNRVASRTDVTPLVAFFAVVAGAVLGTLVSPWAAIPVVIIGIPLLLWTRHLDVTNGTAVLDYAMEGLAADHYEQLRTAFKDFGSCSRIWRVEAAGGTDDWKRNAGARTLIDRSLALPFFGLPPRVQTNVESPVLTAGNQKLYFFPDQIFVFEQSRVGAISYKDLRTMTGAQDFKEGEQVPSDSKVIGTTWLYVNKKGGPDRRFSNNREIPIVRYGLLELRSGSGLDLVYQCSTETAPQTLATALEKFTAQVGEV